MSQILIVGAGISGLTAARELQSSGHDVVVVDKSRGVGGRMATRRFADGAFDTGAQFFTTRSDEFKRATQKWQSEGAVQHWFDGYPSPQIEKPNDHHPRFRGAPGMTGITKSLASALDVRLNEELDTLAFNGQKWSAQSKSGAVFEADKLLLTCPVPQSLALFDSSDQSLPADVRDQLESVRYEPCFAVLAQLEGASAIPAPGLLYINGEPVWWLADNFQKGVSPREGSVTIHSSGAFARENYERDQNEVGEILIGAARQWLGDAPVEAFDVRRWRYSKPENPLDVGALEVRDLKLIFAGDALSGAKVEGAFESGVKAAQIFR